MGPTSRFTWGFHHGEPEKVNDHDDGEVFIKDTKPGFPDNSGLVLCEYGPLSHVPAFLNQLLDRYLAVRTHLLGFLNLR